MTVLPPLWAVTVLVGAWRFRPPPERVRALVVRPDRPRRRPGPRARRWLAASAAAVPALVVLPLAAPVVLVTAWAIPVVRERRRSGEAATAVRRSLPECTDLLRLAVGAGMNVPQAVAAVGTRARGPVAAALAGAAAEVRDGRRCADALDAAAAHLGPDARPVLAALAAADRYGAPLEEPLARLAADARAQRRRAAEEAARRVPVRLLFPLVLCVLPAFALLTVTPLIAGGLRSLRL